MNDGCWRREIGKGMFVVLNSVSNEVEKARTRVKYASRKSRNWGSNVLRGCGQGVKIKVC